MRISDVSPRSRSAARPLALAALLLIAPACGGDGPTQLASPIVVTATGRLERGSTLTLAGTADGVAIAPAEMTISFTPSDAAQVVGTGQIKLLRAGHVSVTVTVPKKIGTAELDVAAPPVVVFDRIAAGGNNRDIWRVDLDGQNLTQLTTDTGDDQDPTAVHGTVVFVSYRAGEGDLYAIPLAPGGATTRLTTTTRDETTPSLSPDGTRLAFSYVLTDVTKVFASSASASDPVQLSPASGSDVIETAPTWSPNGTVAFVSTINGTSDIFGLAPGGTPTLLVGGTNSAEVEPAWSPDGQTLAFVSTRNGGVEVFLLRPSTASVTQLTSGSGSKAQPAWTPDGRIVYLETASGQTHLKWIDPADPATAHPIDTGAGTVGHPAAAMP